LPWVKIAIASGQLMSVLTFAGPLSLIRPP
jgi:hypothetical protein